MCFCYFFICKVIFVKNLDVFIVMFGGFGMFDELVEVFMFVQIGKLCSVLVVMFGSYFWKGLLDWFCFMLLLMGLIVEYDLDIMCIVDEFKDVFDVVYEFYEKCEGILLILFKEEMFYL